MGEIYQFAKEFYLEIFKKEGIMDSLQTSKDYIKQILE